jgi:hypothetical protein
MQFNKIPLSHVIFVEDSEFITARVPNTSKGVHDYHVTHIAAAGEVREALTEHTDRTY